MAIPVFDDDVPEDVLKLIRTDGLVAVDTETDGLSWASNRLDLCQLFSRSAGPVFVRGVAQRPPRLVSLLEDPAVRKVFHFAPFDLRFLAAHWDARVQNVACTKAASKLLDPALPSKGHSLQELLARHLGVHVGKGQVRTSDWSQERLTVEQIDYAASDVIHLPDLLEVLEQKLVVAELVELFSEVCRYMPTAARLEVTGIPDPMTY